MGIEIGRPPGIRTLFYRLKADCLSTQARSPFENGGSSRIWTYAAFLGAGNSLAKRHITKLCHGSLKWSAMWESNPPSQIGSLACCRNTYGAWNLRDDREVLPETPHHQSFGRTLAFLLRKIGRDSRIRTDDILLPKQALYQAELHPVWNGADSRIRTDDTLVGNEIFYHWIISA